MSRKIKNAKDLATNELIYFKSHAQATFMSDGTTVEEAINNIEIPTVPTKTSELENDSKFITIDDVPEVTVPTKTSELTNDSGFITINDVPVLEIPEEYVTDDELSQKGFLVGEETSEELDDVETNTYVKYVTQTLTDEQKNQVRENLGIPSVDYIISLFEELKTLINNNSASDAIAVLDKAILDMHKLQ